MSPGLRGLSRPAREGIATVRSSLSRQPLSPVRFVIFGRGRSGSTTLVSLLDGLPGVHCDGEILNEPVLLPRAFVRARCVRAATPAYGCKILSYQVQRVQPILRRMRFIKGLDADGFRIVYLKRENLVEHAVSNIRARQFGFHRAASAADASGKTVVDPAELMHWIAQSEALDRFEAACLAGVAHLELTYERHLAFEELHRPTVLHVAGFLGLSTEAVPPAHSAYRKVSPRALRDSVANYEQLADLLAQTPYARYLD